MKKLAEKIIIGKTGGGRTHPEILKLKCKNSCKLNITPRADNKNIGDISCNKANCQGILTKIGHTSSGIGESVQKKLIHSSCQVFNLKGGFGKNANNNHSNIIIHGEETYIQLTNIRYVDLQGTDYINKKENLGTIINITNNE